MNFNFTPSRQNPDISSINIKKEKFSVSPYSEYVPHQTEKPLLLGIGIDNVIIPRRRSEGKKPIFERIELKESIYQRMKDEGCGIRIALKTAARRRKFIRKHDRRKSSGWKPKKFKPGKLFCLACKRSGHKWNYCYQLLEQYGREGEVKGKRASSASQPTTEKVTDKLKKYIKAETAFKPEQNESKSKPMSFEIKSNSTSLADKFGERFSQLVASTTKLSSSSKSQVKSE